MNHNEIIAELRNLRTTKMTIHKGDQRIKILEFEFKYHEYCLKIEVDGQLLHPHFNQDKVELFINSLTLTEPVEEVPETSQNSDSSVVYLNSESKVLAEHTQTFKKLSEILMDDINKVRNNKDYIPQAQQVSKSAQTMINLAKLELDFYKNIQ